VLKLADSLAACLGHHGARDPGLWLLDADLGDSYGFSEDLLRAFGSRFIQVGIAEQSLVSVAAGLARLGKRPWVFSFAAFLCSRAHDQIRCGVSQMQLPVTLVGANAGIDGVKNGNTHVSLIDINLMNSLPNIDIWSPGSDVELRYAVDSIMLAGRAAYLRLPKGGAEKPRVVEQEISELQGGSDVLLLSCGIASSWALDLAASLRSHAISARVVQVVKLKPLPDGLDLVIRNRYSGIFTLEDHSVVGGFGDIVASAYPEVHIRRLGWPQTWLPARIDTGDIRAQFGLDTAGLSQQIRQCLDEQSGDPQ
jgi:transketolase